METRLVLVCEAAALTLLLRMRCMKRSQVAWYEGCSISCVSRRKVKARIIGSSLCGRLPLGCLHAARPQSFRLAVPCTHHTKQAVVHLP